jgi:hypothetical protein
MVKKKEFHFTFKVFLRLLIFSILVYFSIKYFQQKVREKSVLGAVDVTLALDEETQSTFLSDLYQKLPESSRQQVEHLNENQIVVFLQTQLDGFPSRQIKEIQKSFIKKVSEDMIKNIDEN